ncbi:hypothetical protein [Pontibacter mangrovi]|uniref:Uncharacterized protein n=1 Tax=Pontibacter mangrovi TaxID=2589816 RepID=A0A501W5J5_9BACT|nr:hypothetical protein [Pontibacter mangrovi]TPE42097.1 hypothetical protein FJM65_18595 [Pontibacter mangrovi]
MKNEKLSIEFGIPEHGWLPVKIAFNSFRLEFNASGVPANPIDQLISSLRSVIQGIKAEVWWHLEPEGYYFEFEKFSGEYTLNISFAKSENSDREIVFKTNGSFESLISPVYRAIKKFADNQYVSQNWPIADKTELEKLTELVNEAKLHRTTPKL